MKKYLLVILGTMRVQMKNSFARPMFKFCLIISPIANTILLYYMFKNSQIENFITYVILGAGLSSIWECICFSSIGDINRERWSGTLSIIFSAPAGFNLIILGKIIGNTILSLVTFALTILTSILLFKAQIQISNLPLLIISLFLLLIAFIVMSQVFAYLLTLSRKTTLYMNCLSVPIALICGFVIPIEMLPKWLSIISYIFPPTWAVKLIRYSFIYSSINSEFIYNLLILIGETLIFIVLTLIFYKTIVKRVKINASLELA